jgi:hypothetical protein
VRTGAFSIQNKPKALHRFGIKIISLVFYLALGCRQEVVGFLAKYTANSLINPGVEVIHGFLVLGFYSRMDSFLDSRFQ